MQGYQSEDNVVWELISRVDGATDLCNSAFTPYTAPAHEIQSEAYLKAAANQSISEEDAAAIAQAATEGYSVDPDDDDMPPLIAMGEPLSL